MLRKIAALCVLVLPLVPAHLAAQQQPFVPRDHYTKLEVMIPMRDGVRLYTRIFIPKDTAQPHPFVMVRTPYANFPYGRDSFPARLDHITEAYARENFILVGQDVRGRWMSEGEFLDVRPVIEHKTSNHDVDEPSDTYDTIDWLIKNVPHNNGRVGVRGTSYPGFYAEMAALSGHPALKVASPQAPVTEWMGGDDFFHNGALLLAHSFFFNSFGRPRPQPTTVGPPGLDYGTPDGYAWYLKLGALSNINPRFYHDSVAFWDSIVAHPMWDAFWAARSGRPHLHDIQPAVLWVGGWFDTENLWGALHAYAAAGRQSPGTENRLVMGPWYHGQWNTPTGDSLGLLAWGMRTAQYYADSIEIPFFNARLLDGQSAPRRFAAAVFETGRNVWHFLDIWPPANAVATSFYLADGGRLATVVPAPARGAGAGARAFDEYVSDPAKPVPYTDEITQWYNPAFMLGDQRFAARRPDVLVYQTAPLDADLTVAGPIDVDLAVSTSGTDQDFIVKVVDVFPDDYGRSQGYRTYRALGGYEMLVRGDVMRGKYRNDPEHAAHPEPFRPGVPASVKFRLNDVYHTFRAGHRLMVQVQSTWFPMIDRNPGVFENIFLAKDGDFRATTQRIYRSAGLASRIVLPLLR